MCVPMPNSTTSKMKKERQRQIADWQGFRKGLKASKIYNTLHEKWDLYIPFLERAYQLLRNNGQMILSFPMLTTPRSMQ